MILDEDQERALALLQTSTRSSRKEISLVPMGTGAHVDPITLQSGLAGRLPLPKHSSTCGRRVGQNATTATCVAPQECPGATKLSMHMLRLPSCVAPPRTRPQRTWLLALRSPRKKLAQLVQVLLDGNSDWQ